MYYIQIRKIVCVCVHALVSVSIPCMYGGNNKLRGGGGGGGGGGEDREDDRERGNGSGEVVVQGEMERMTEKGVMGVGRWWCRERGRG